MNADLQFIGALVGAIGGALGAAKIVGSSIEKSRANPVYELKFENGEQFMGDLKDQVSELARKTDDQVKELSKEISAVRHAQNNTQMVVKGLSLQIDQMPSALIGLLRSLGIIT